MGVIKITFDSASVTSKQDADINHFLVGSQNGIFAWVLGRCLASTSNNYINFQSGYVQAYGRRVFVEAGTKIAISLDGQAYGYVVVRINLGDNAVTLEKKESSSSWPSLTQEDLQNGGLIYEIPLTRYTKTTSSLTLDTSYSPPQILSDYVRASNLCDSLENRMASKYGDVWDFVADHSYGNTYIFTGITTSNASRGIGSVYVGGCSVVFSTDAVSGSGGVIYYYYSGRERSLSMQLTYQGLYIEASDGSVPKYARVIK